MSKPIDLNKGANAVIIGELRKRGGATHLNLTELSDQSRFPAVTLSNTLSHLRRHGVVVIETKGAGRRPPFVRLLPEN